MVNLHLHSKTAPGSPPVAMIVTNQGLSIFPGEIVLTGIATDPYCAIGLSDWRKARYHQCAENCQAAALAILTSR